MKKEFIKFFIFCPLPNEKKPIYDLLIVKKKLEKIEKLFSFSYSQQEKFLFFKDSIIQLFISFFLLPRWNDGIKILKKPLINYEETSWYDGEIWEKPLSLIKNDQLLSRIIFKRSFKKLAFLFLINFWLLLIFLGSLNFL
jgi:hypothetical protein